MPKTDTAIPPQSPEVEAQQAGPALAQFARKAVAQQSGNPPNAEPPGKQFVQQALQQIAELMAKIAKVFSVDHPELMPLMQRMAGIGKTMENEFSKASQAQTGSGPESEPQPPQAAEGQASSLGL